MTRPRLLIACVGNIFMGDDGFGVEVARRLVERSWPPGVRVVDFGIRGIDFLYALLDDPDHLIIVDAVDRGCAAGSLYIIEPESDTFGRDCEAMDAHGTHPAKAIKTARSMGATLASIRLVGCQPQTLEPGIGLSVAVQVAVENAVELVDRIVRKIDQAAAVQAC